MFQDDARHVFHLALDIGKAFGAQTMMMTALVTLAKYTSPLFAVDQKDGMNNSRPFADDAMMFGIVFYLITRTFVTSFFAVRKILIHPVVDVTLLMSLKYLTIWIIWIFVDHSRPFKEVVYRVVLPVSWTPILTVPLAIWKSTNSFLMNVRNCFRHFASYWTVIMLNLGFAVTFLAFSGREDTTGEIVITAADMTISVAVFGVGFPLLRFLSSFLLRKSVVIYEKQVPKNRIEEMTANLTKFIFIAGQDAFWNTLSKVLIMDVRNNIVFYLSLVCSLLITVAVRLHSLSAFRNRHLSKKVFPAKELSLQDVDEAVTQKASVEGKKVKEELLPPAGEVFKSGKMREIERKMTEKSARKGTTRRIHADKLVELETANLSLAIGRIAEVDRKSSEIITGNEIVKDELKEEDNSKEGLPSYAIGSASNASPDAPVPAISTQKCADIEKGALILDSKKDILTQHLESLSGFENVESLQQWGDEDDEPFVPISEEATYGFQSLSSIYSDWAARKAAAIILLLLTSTFPQSTWTSCRGYLPVIELIRRSFASLALGAVVDAFSIIIDQKFGNIDYGKGLEELCHLHISWSALSYLATTSASVGGLLILTQPGIFKRDECFREGRRSWG